jgi:hypothetical protein
MTQTKTNNMKFTNRSQAKKTTNLTYLGGCGTSSKIKKNSKVLKIDTYVLYLAPHTMSGYNVCPLATKDCIKGCLNTSGRASLEILSGSSNESNIIKARIKKTKLFYENRTFFFDWLIAEITASKASSEAKGNEFAVRLNGTSDINWNAYKIKGKTIFQIFPTVQFYDYTKVVNRFNNIPDNYHLTFSYTGYNWSDCEKVLNMGYNVAAVFNIYKTYNMLAENIVPLPTSYKGYNIIDGDITDYRPFDEKSTIVALRFKKIADKETASKVIKSRFVINPKSKDCSYEKIKELEKV